jgi:hypothetical protein
MASEPVFAAFRSARGRPLPAREPQGVHGGEGSRPCTFSVARVIPLSASGHPVRIAPEERDARRVCEGAGRRASRKLQTSGGLSRCGIDGADG